VTDQLLSAIGTFTTNGASFAAITSMTVTKPDVLDVVCTIAWKPAGGSWHRLTGAGVLLDPDTFAQRRAQSRLIVQGGMDLDVHGLGERMLLGVCGEVGYAVEAADLVLDGVTYATIRPSTADRFFAVPVLAPRFDIGADVHVSLHDHPGPDSGSTTPRPPHPGTGTVEIDPGGQDVCCDL
jgi:hypothetical protein